MNYNHKDIVIFISTVISKIINYAVGLLFIVGAGIILYMLYIFIVQPYAPGEDPVQKWWKERKLKEEQRNNRSTMYQEHNVKPFLKKNGVEVYIS